MLTPTIMPSRTLEGLIWRHRGHRLVEPTFRRKKRTRMALEFSFIFQGLVRCLIIRTETRKRPTVCGRAWKRGKPWKCSGDGSHINQEEVCPKRGCLEGSVDFPSNAFLTSTGPINGACVLERDFAIILPYSCPWQGIPLQNGDEL